MGLSGLLAIDIGNTNVHLGLWRDDAWALNWRARTVPDKMPDEYGVLVRNFLSSADLRFDAVSAVIISSVVPPLTTSFVELVRRYHKLEPLVVDSRTNTGIGIAIDQPEQAGADRIVNAAAVTALYGGPAIVIDFGTATTFDVVTASGDYAGGAIAPGVNLALDALVSRAARLHKVDILPPPHAVGGNTIHAMQSGLFWGYVSLVEGLVKRVKDDMIERGMAGPDATPESIQVIATGGLAVLFDQHTAVIDRIASELTLDGLRVIYEINQGLR
jgi:type III pantothenate kinase